MLDHILSEPVLHSFVAPPRLSSGASFDVEKANLFDPTQASVTLFDVCTDRIRATYLLRHQPITQRICLCLKHLLVCHNQIEQLPCFLIRAEALQADLWLIRHSTPDPRHSAVDPRHFFLLPRFLICAAHLQSRAMETTGELERRLLDLGPIGRPAPPVMVCQSASETEGQQRRSSHATST